MFDPNAVYTVSLTGDVMSIAQLISNRYGFGLEATIAALILMGAEKAKETLDAS